MAYTSGKANGIGIRSKISVKYWILLAFGYTLGSLCLAVTLGQFPVHLAHFRLLCCSWLSIKSNQKCNHIRDTEDDESEHWGPKSRNFAYDIYGLHGERGKRSGCTLNRLCLCENFLNVMASITGLACICRE